MLDPRDIRRKAAVVLKDHKIEPPSHLPVLEYAAELTPKQDSEVASRVIVLTYIVGLGYDGSVSDINDAVDEFNLRNLLSDKEAHMLSGTLSDQDRIDCSWLTESIQAMGWSLGLVGINFNKFCDDDLASALPEPFTDPSDFIAGSRLRVFAEIYEMADLHYQLHWLAKKEAWETLSTIREKRKALDWIIGVEGNWDEVPSDT